MTLYLYNIPSACMGMIVVGATVLCVFAGYAVVSRCGLVRIDAEQRAMAMSMVSIITTINSLIIAFAAISVWDAYNDADRTVAAEATCAGELARDLAAFGSPAAGAAGYALRGYLEHVVHIEWPVMQQSLQADSRTELRFDEMFDLVSRINPANPRQTALLTEVLARVNEMTKYRQQRLLSLEVAMPDTLWAVIIIISALTFALLYVLRPTPFSVTLILSWAVTLGLAFFFVLAVDRPYAGAVSVSAAPYHKTIDALVKSRTWPPSDAHLQPFLTPKGDVP